MSHASKTPSFGRIKFGSEPRRPALPMAIVVGLVAAALIAAVVAAWGDYSSWWQNFVFFAIALLPVSIAATWVIVVDRLSIPGAVSRPEQTVENSWMKEAASTTFYITLGAAGLASAIATLFFDGPVGRILMWVGLAMMAVFAISYAVAKHKA